MVNPKRCSRQAGRCAQRIVHKFTACASTGGDHAAFKTEFRSKSTRPKNRGTLNLPPEHACSVKPVCHLALCLALRVHVDQLQQDGQATIAPESVEMRPIASQFSHRIERTEAVVTG